MLREKLVTARHGVGAVMTSPAEEEAEVCIRQHVCAHIHVLRERQRERRRRREQILTHGPVLQVKPDTEKLALRRIIVIITIIIVVIINKRKIVHACVQTHTHT